MKNKFMTICLKLQDLMSREEGQDLVEYALIIALIAFGAMAGMHGLANSINNAFADVGSTLINAV